MKRWANWMVAGFLLGLPVWAGPDDAKHPGRLVVADGKAGLLRVIDLETGELVGSFSAPGPANVYGAGNGIYAFAVHREQNRVSVVYGGLRQEDHGDHKDLVVEAPYILQTFTTGPKPTHFSSHDGIVTIYNDGDGTVAVLDEKSLGLGLRMREVATGAPDHGAPLAMGNVVLAGSLNRGVVEVFSQGGQKITTFSGCPRLHGEAALGNRIAFGCSDGVLLLERQGNGFVSRKLPNPAGALQNARVGTLVSHAKYPFFIGNFGQGLVRVDNQLSVYPLPANPVRFGFDKNGVLVVLTADGSLHTLEAPTGKVTASLKISAPITASGEGAVRPGLALGDGKAFVTLPDKGEVLEVELAEMVVKRRFNVGGAPGSVAWLWVDGVRH
ncbi:hypothetical protein [Meiothermus sp.]|uniref:hypothetical protein n=1 Tax=Meiothermus sp. TaxID=1955249 RepID=UPI00307E1DB7